MHKKWIDILNACKDNPTIKITSGLARTRSLKEPPKKAEKRFTNADTTQLSRNYATKSRAFSTQINGSPFMKEIMTPWYQWAVDIMCWGA